MNKNRSQQQQVSDIKKSLRAQVEEFELKARYWESMYKLRHFTLESAKLQPEYDKYIAEETERNQKAMEELKAEIAKTEDLKLEVPTIGNTEKQE